MEKHQFKPFDQVLVRDEDNAKWFPAHYKYYNPDDEQYPYTCDNRGWKQCIPYNEETAHLVGTTEPYNEPEPKEWEIRSNNGMYRDKFTSSELKHFIETTVINNKDITNFTVTRIF